jgi:hypothetical protein
MEGRRICYYRLSIFVLRMSEKVVVNEDLYKYENAGGP